MLVRRVTSMTFTVSTATDDARVIVASKAGDVYSYPLATAKCETPGESLAASQGEDEAAAGEPILGHVSMILDLVNKKPICVTVSNGKISYVWSYSLNIQKFFKLSILLNLVLD